jgi:hypothetical protein
MKQSILIFVIAWISAVSAFAGVRPSVDPMDGEEFATGEMTAGEPLRIHKLEVPPNVRTVTVHLLIASPNELDLDLYVYDYPPNYEGEVDFDNFRAPEVLCESNFRGPIETCTLSTAGLERLWIAVEAYEGKGSTRYQLRSVFVSAGLIDPNYELLILNSSVQFGNEARGYYFDLDQGDVATLVLDGTDRNISVRDSEGNEYEAVRTDVQRKQVWIGSPFMSSDNILTGLQESRTFTVKIGEHKDRFGERVTSLSLTGPTQRDGSNLADNFLIPFSLERTEFLPADKQGRPRRKIGGKLKDEVLASYYVSPRQLGSIANIFPEGNFVVAICDRLGIVRDMSDRSVHLERDMGSENEAVYLIVTKSPFSTGTNIKYELFFEDDYSIMKR